MTTVLISPNLVVQRNDPFTTGVVYMPIGLAYVASGMRAAGLSIEVIDAFGERSRQARRDGDFLVLGLRIDEVMSRIPPDVTSIFVYANQLINHSAVVALLGEARKRFPGVPRVVLENTQAVTAYALAPVSSALYEAGADYLLSGEGDRRAARVAKAFRDRASQSELDAIDGLSRAGTVNPPVGFIDDLDDLPVPAWDLFPLEGYWSLRFAHGPQGSSRYLPMLTSRGCPYPCRFCVVPATNARTWRARSGASVAAEMKAMKEQYGVTEFHLEDLNPTIQDKRIREICSQIIAQDLKVTWKIVAGTKVESMKNEETIDLMWKAGCRYISISPESGSARVLKLIDKPFKVPHATKLIRKMSALGIRSQACFVLGFPEETPEDRVLTRGLVKDLTRAGLDEIALFIISPVPGSDIFADIKGYTSLSQLNFTPTWRQDYVELNRFRLRLYLAFLLWKLRYHPVRIARQALNFLRRRFETKMEMVPYKALVYKLLDAFAPSA
jgi:anaerobic magnesium-protoporphyrin IX monomethyl ester cyclase